MADFDFKLDKGGMDAFVKSQALGDSMFDVAQGGAAYARSIAPVASGGYKDSIKAEQVTVPVTKKSEPRAGAMIYSDIEYAGAVESNHKVLNRTADYLKSKGA